MSILESVVFGISRRPNGVYELWFRANITHEGAEYTMTEDQCVHGVPEGMTISSTTEFLMTMAVELMRQQEQMGPGRSKPIDISL